MEAGHRSKDPGRHPTSETDERARELAENTGAADSSGPGGGVSVRTWTFVRLALRGYLYTVRGMETTENTATPAIGAQVVITRGVYRGLTGTVEAVEADDLGGVVVVRTAPDTLTHVEPEEISLANVADWHRYIAEAPNFAEAQSRMEEALRAGVDFFALRAFQDAR